MPGTNTPYARDFAAHSDPLAVILGDRVVPPRRFPTARELVTALRGLL